MKLASLFIALISFNAAAAVTALDLKDPKTIPGQYELVQKSTGKKLEFSVHNSGAVQTLPKSSITPILYVTFGDKVYSSADEDQYGFFIHPNGKSIHWRIAEKNRVDGESNLILSQTGNKLSLGGDFETYEQATLEKIADLKK